MDTPAAQRAGDARHAPFPTLEVRSLAGRAFVLPADLPAPLTVVICAFRQRHQGTVDEWIAWAVAEAGVAPSPSGLDPSAPSVAIEVPVLGRRYRSFRGFIDGGMATGIGDPVVLARTFTAYTDVAAFCRAAGIVTTEAVAAMVVRRDGSVLAHVTGPPTPEGRAAIATALGSPAATVDPRH